MMKKAMIKRKKQPIYLQYFLFTGQIVSVHCGNKVILYPIYSSDQSFTKRKIKCLVNLVG